MSFTFPILLLLCVAVHVILTLLALFVSLFYTLYLFPGVPDTPDVRDVRGLHVRVRTAAFILKYF